MKDESAVIIGAGPAGLTAALELLERTKIRPIVIEQSEYMGGISRTIAYKGNRMDVGGHRFFSKSERVMEWWLRILPLAKPSEPRPLPVAPRQKAEGEVPSVDPPIDEPPAMLLRKRRSRIFFLGKFFDYPVRLNLATLRNLGIVRSIRIVFSYLRSALFPLREERTLEQFFINRFGRVLYRTLFQSYTEKVWGVPCDRISPEWGGQRVKGLSIWKVVWHFLSRPFRGGPDLAQKGTETSLIEQFLYPKYGPGQMWEEVAKKVRAAGGEIWTGYSVDKISVEGNRVGAVRATNVHTGEVRSFTGDHFLSTMPIRDLVRALDTDVPAEVRSISEGLPYRDFITVGLLLERMRGGAGGKKGNGLIKDNWIYIQEPEVLLGRLQVFNNWSPYLVADPSKLWIGLEYFCSETDALWKKSDDETIRFAIEELHRIGFIHRRDVLDATVVRMQKVYPAYFGTYPRLAELRAFVDRFENLFLIGRNGMHRYNNQDHSMLTAMVAVENIAEGRRDKSNIWTVNTEQEYHESK